MSAPPDEHEVRVLAALQRGAALVMHRRGERGPYYTLGGRRLSVTLLKALEARRWIAREGGPDRAAVTYALTAEGEAALAARRAT